VGVLDHNITYRYSYTLIVGSLASIRKYIVAHAVKPWPPNYRFEKDRQHWHYANAQDTGWPISGELKVSMAHSNPQLVGPDGFWHADMAPTLHVSAAFPKGIESLRVFWSRTDVPGFAESRVLNFKVIGDGMMHDYSFELSKNPEYKGIITGIRLDPETAGLPGSYVKVKRVGFR
jgi:hypothetical protein